MFNAGVRNVWKKRDLARKGWIKNRGCGCDPQRNCTTSYSHELKPFNAPFSSTDDPCFFVAKRSVFKIFWTRNETKPGVYKKSEKQRMFVSSQTYEGLKITVHTVIVLLQLAR